MKNKFAIARVAILLAAGAYFAVRFATHSADPGSLVKTKPSVKSICVQPIQNLSHKPIQMDGVDDELVAQLQKVGFESRKTSQGAQCDATTNAELVDVTGRSRKTARVDFRLTLTGEQVPRMSSSVEAKSGGKKGESLADSVGEFSVNPDPKEEISATRQAIVAALQATASQIDQANKRGLPPWQAKEQ